MYAMQPGLSVPKILAPIDFSGPSAGAAAFAGWLAGEFHSGLTLLHVVNSGVDEWSDRKSSDPAVRGLCAAWEKRAQTLMTDLPVSQSLNVALRHIVLSGDPAEEILHFAHFDGTSLIVLPTHGDEPLRPFVLGSVASKVLHSAACPVLTGIHAPDAFPRRLRSFKRILCAVDLCRQSVDALTWASHFCREFQGQLTIAHITPSTDAIGAYFSPERHNWAVETRHEEFAAQARRKIEQMQKSVGSNAEVLIDSGMDVPQSICDAGSRMGADLIVVGRGSSAGIERLRTKVCSIVRQSPCPVLAV